MSLQDEINRLQQTGNHGDPKQAVIEALKNDIEATIEKHAQEAYQKICKLIASKTVLGACISDTVIVHDKVQLSFSHNHPTYITYSSIYQTLMPIPLNSFPDVKTFESEGIYYLKLAGYKKGIDCNALFLTESGKRFFDVLARKCNSDRITVKCYIEHVDVFSVGFSIEPVIWNINECISNH